MSVLEELSDLRQRAVARLKELEPLVAEYQQLQAVLARLGADALADGAPAAKPASRSRSTTASRPARKAASRRSAPRRRSAASPGSREADVVRLVGERPGISVPEIARELNVDPTGLYAIVRRLTARGRMRKDGTRLELVSSGE